MDELESEIRAAIVDVTQRRDKLNKLLQALDGVIAACCSGPEMPSQPIPADPFVPDPDAAGPFVLDLRKKVIAPKRTGPRRLHGTGTICRRGGGPVFTWYIRYLDFTTGKRVERSGGHDYAEAEKMLDQKILELNQWRAARATEKLTAAGFVHGNVADGPKQPAAEPVVEAFEKAAAKVGSVTAKLIVDGIKTKAEKKDPRNDKCTRGSCTHTRAQHCKPGDAGPIRCMGCWCFEFLEPAK